MRRSKDPQRPQDDRPGSEKVEIRLRDQDVRAVAEDRVALRVDPYVRRRWTESNLPRDTFDVQGERPPITLADVGLDCQVFSAGGRGTGPFERVLLREGDH